MWYCGKLVNTDRVVSVCSVCSDILSKPESHTTPCQFSCCFLLNTIYIWLYRIVVFTLKILI